MNATNIRQRIQDARFQAGRLEGMRKAGAELSEQLNSDVSFAKGRMLLSEEVSRVFEAMQLRAHERSVGTLESLLTAVLHDVMPDEGEVRLLPTYKANTTHLDVSLQKDGGLEDIYDAQGGAVTNVVCTGLRFAALARTKNRRLMVLDEPDCWVKPTLVPAFIRTIGEVSRMAGVQTLLISHHSSEFLDLSEFNVVQFDKDEVGKVFAKTTTQLRDWESESQPGIRAIELFNVRRHEHTYVPCFPGATLFLGDNNLGKSTAIVGAFKMVAYGESDESVLRRGTEEARIVVHLENNRRVEWSRHLKRSPTVLYKLWEGTTLVSEGRPKTRGEVPDWVTEALGISKVDDMDIQVGHQKNPVFLLNDSAPRRAQILSVGREASYLKELMRGYEDVKSRDREVIKQGELQLIRLKLRMGYLERLAPEIQRLELLQATSDAMAKVLESREQLENLIDKLNAVTAALATLEKESDALSQLPEVPVLVDNKELSLLTDTIERYSRVDSVATTPEVPLTPELEDLSELRRLGGLIASREAFVTTCPDVPTAVPSLPDLLDVSELTKLIERLTAQGQAVNSAETMFSKETAEAQSAEDALKTMKDEAGECPLCGHAFESEEQHAH